MTSKTDDFSYAPGECSEITTVIRTTTTQTVIHKPNIVDCTFENKDTCNWKNDETGQFQWTVRQGPTDYFSGPWADHTTDTIEGSYLMIEAKEKKPNDTARIQSPLINIEKAGGCFQVIMLSYSS